MNVSSVTGIPGSPGQRAVKRLLLLLLFMIYQFWWKKMCLLWLARERAHGRGSNLWLLMLQPIGYR